MIKPIPSTVLSKTKYIVLLFFVFIFRINSYSQSVSDSIKAGSAKIIKGVVLDFSKKEPLPYANIVISHSNTGLVTNEQGNFQLNTDNLSKNDSVSFQYIGYKTRKLTVKQLDSSAVVYLKESINNLNEVFVFSSEIDAESIVKKVIKNKDQNYKKRPVKIRTFVRNKSVSDIKSINFEFKKSSFHELNQEKIEEIEQKIPKQSISFTDFLGDLYFSENKTDSVQLKIDPIKYVGLKDKSLADVEELESFFEKFLTDVKEGEYWKVKSGILGGEIEMKNDIDQSVKDSLKRRNQIKFKTEYFRNTLDYYLKYSSFKDKDDWEFLYRTSRYEYTLIGGTVVNDEDVYIIDFVPKRSGKFKGRMYITLKTYALIRADYQFTEGKTGTNIHLFGVGYSMDVFKGSVAFEKKFGTYQLKYCSKKEGTSMSVDRNLSLLKKKERFLFDKKLKEIKIRLNMSLTEEDSFEMFVLENEKITEKQFKDFMSKQFMKMIYVDQFNDDLWKGYSIIEPTRQMRAYKKLH